MSTDGATVTTLASFECWPCELTPFQEGLETGHIYFNAGVPTGGARLFVTDGSAEGTRLVDPETLGRLTRKSPSYLVDSPPRSSSQPAAHASTESSKEHRP